MLLDFVEMKRTFFLIFVIEKYFTRELKRWSINRIGEKNTFHHLASRNTANHLKIYHMLLHPVSYNCLEFCKNFMNVYRLTIIVLKKGEIFITFSPFNRREFYPNCTEISSKKTKFKKIIVLKLKIYTNNFQRDLHILGKYF